MTDANPSCIVLLSGGIDSAVCAHLAKEKYQAVNCLFFNYGQKNVEKASACAKKVSDSIGANYYEISMPWYDLIKQGCAILDDSVTPDSSVSRDTLPNTVVPFRNATMISIATAFADAWDVDAIYIGATDADSTGYPDCRPEFLWAMQNALFNGSSKAHPILEVPLENMEKEDVIRLGASMKVQFANTWSCYTSQPTPCGKCIACNSRKTGFSKARISDPIFE